jgi:diguanylate cyclase (GGDEF)-like protein
MTPISPKILPRSLFGRIFAVFILILLIFLGAGLGTFYRFQFLQHIEETQDNAGALIEVAAQAVEDSVVIGDYDTVQRTLNKMLYQSPFKSATFFDMGGGVIRVQPQARPAHAPGWLEALVAGKLSEANRIVTVGGKDYGVIRLHFDEGKIASRLWYLVLQAASLAAVFFVLSLLLMRYLLKRWLHNLDRLHSYEHDVAAGAVEAEAMLYADAPREIEEAIKAVNRTAASLRSQYGERIDRLMNSLVQHKRAMDQAAIVSELDANGRLTAVNDQFVRSSGLPRAALLGNELARVGAPNFPSGEPWTPSRSVWNGEVVIAGPHGACHWYRTVVPIFDAAGAVEKYICIDIDITERKEFERTILDNAKRHSLLAAFGRKALTPDHLAELLDQACASAAEGLGASHAALFEAAPGTHQLILRAGVGWPADMIGAAFEASDGDQAACGPCPAALGEPQAIRTGAVRDIVGRERVYGSIGVYTQQERQFGADEFRFLDSLATILASALERHDANERLTWLAQYDALTNLPNRRHLASCIEDAVARAGRDGHRAGVMFIDLDRFKHVNDMLGHAAGDELLAQAARRLEQCVRAGDVVARLGGDEFAVVLPEIAGQAESAAIAARLIEALARPFPLQGQQIFVSASVGIAAYPDDGTSADMLLKSADIAMYSAKNSGRNNYQFYAAEMNRQAAQRLLTESQLRVALERGQFVLHYQPKAKLSDGSIRGFEALLRWDHPERGLVAPLEFISILEDTGLIIPVGEWVIAEVCRQLTQWQQDGRRALPVAINLSARQLQQADLAATVQRIVGAAGVEPRLLEFELTESMLMTDPEAAVATLGGLKAQGMRLSVDDFGTGYSSLAYLKRFPLDALKIDRTFVRDLPGDADDAAITKAVIRLAHSLNLKVVAEGVETLEQVRMLEDYGCDEIQGYYIGRPQPAQHWDALLVPPLRKAAA